MVYDVLTEAHGELLDDKDSRLRSLAEQMPCRVKTLMAECSTAEFNLTNTLLHNHLGHAHSPGAAVTAMSTVATHISNLEYNLGSKYENRVADYLCRLNGVEAALIGSIHALFRYRTTVTSYPLNYRPKPDAILIR